jgi:hypothetical protein
MALHLRPRPLPLMCTPPVWLPTAFASKSNKPLLVTTKFTLASKHPTAVAGGNYSLGQGTNTIDFAYREPNAQLDKLYLQIDGAEPTGMGDSSPANCN